jgi:hypothetical protein
VAVDSDGDAIVAGTDSADVAWRRSITRSGTVSSATTVGTYAANASATITPTGSARVAYQQKGAGQIYVRTS